VYCTIQSPLPSQWNRKEANSGNKHSTLLYSLWSTGLRTTNQHELEGDNEGDCESTLELYKLNQYPF